MKKLKLGIIGLGRAGFGMHTAELRGKEELFEIAAVCDVERDRCENMQKCYGAKIYARVEDIVADPDIDVIDIATRSCDHFKHAMTALNAGKTVFLEKPICMTYEEAKKLFAYAEKDGKKRVYVRHNRRFEPHFMQICRLIASGIIGAFNSVIFLITALTVIEQYYDLGFFFTEVWRIAEPLFAVSVFLTPILWILWIVIFAKYKKAKNHKNQAPEPATED